MPIGSSLGISLPTQGGNTGTWGTDLNTEINKIVTAVEAQVPVTAIDVSATFNINSQAVDNIGKLILDVQGSNPADLRSLFVTSSGELAFRDNANNVVTITSAGSLNIASSGGLGNSGGDYGTSGITFDWSGTLYDALDGTTSNAPVRADSFILRQSTTDNSVTIDVPATVTSSYNLTLPSAVSGGATRALQSDASGNCSWSNTYSEDITLSGSAELKHGDRILSIPAASGERNGSGTTGVATGYWSPGVGNDSIVFPISLDVGDRIRTVRFMFEGANTSTKTFTVYSVFYSTSAVTTINSGTSTSATASTVTLSGGSLPYTVAQSSTVWARAQMPSTSDRVFGIEVTYDRP